MTKYISCDCECKLNSTTCSSNQKENNKKCQCECKNYHTCKKDYGWDPGTCVCENSEHLKSIANSLVIAYDAITAVIDIVLTKMTNTIAKIVSINFHSKKVRYITDRYILHAVLLAIILLLVTTIISYRYANHRSKQKGIYALAIYMKMENNKF